MMTTTPKEKTTTVTTANAPTLLLAFELGDRTWKLGFTIGFGQPPRMRPVPARATDRVVEEIARAKTRFRLPADVPVVSCYEAGREGLWLHRWLVAQGRENHVIDASSIEVNRRARRAKTDRLDLYGLVTLLARHVHGDRRVWHVVRVPSGPKKMRATSIAPGKRSNKITRAEYVTSHTPVMATPHLSREPAAALQHAATSPSAGSRAPGSSVGHGHGRS